MESEKGDIFWLKKFNIKPCKVNVDEVEKVETVNVRVRCTAYCDLGDNMSPMLCHVQLLPGSNTISIKM